MQMQNFILFAVLGLLAAIVLIRMQEGGTRAPQMPSSSSNTSSANAVTFAAPHSAAPMLMGATKGGSLGEIRAENTIKDKFSAFQ